MTESIRNATAYETVQLTWIRATPQTAERYITTWIVFEMYGAPNARIHR